MSEGSGSEGANVEFVARFRSLLAAWGGCEISIAEYLGCEYKTMYEVLYENRQLPELAIIRLAKYWGVTPGYLMGEPGAEKEPKAVPETKARLRRYLLAREPEFGPDTAIGYRTREVLRFLMKAAPEYYTRDFLTRWIHLSGRTFNRIMAQQEEIGPYTIHRVALLSGIPLKWFWQDQADLLKADLEPTPQRLQFDNGVMPLFS